MTQRACEAVAGTYEKVLAVCMCRGADTALPGVETTAKRVVAETSRCYPVHDRRASCSWRHAIGAAVTGRGGKTSREQLQEVTLRRRPPGHIIHALTWITWFLLGVRLSGGTVVWGTAAGDTASGGTAAGGTAAGDTGESRSTVSRQVSSGRRPWRLHLTRSNY